MKTSTTEKAAAALYALGSEHEVLSAILMSSAKWITHNGGDIFWDCLRHMVKSTDFKLIEPGELSESGVYLVDRNLRFSVFDIDEHVVRFDMPVAAFVAAIESDIKLIAKKGDSVDDELKQLDLLIQDLSKLRTRLASLSKK